MDLGSYLRGEWAVIAQAPVTFIVGAIIVAVAVWTLSGLYYKGRIETLKGRIDALKDGPSGPAKWS